MTIRISLITHSCDRTQRCSFIHSAPLYPFNPALSSLSLSRSFSFIVLSILVSQHPSRSSWKTARHCPHQHLHLNTQQPSQQDCDHHSRDIRHLLVSRPPCFCDFKLLKAQLDSLGTLILPQVGIDTPTRHQQVRRDDIRTRDQTSRAGRWCFPSFALHFLAPCLVSSSKSSITNPLASSPRDNEGDTEPPLKELQGCRARCARSISSGHGAICFASW